MCRLFGGLSAKPTDFADFLVRDPCSLLVQANARKDKPQADGWGVAALDKEPVVFRSVGWAAKERKTFAAIAGGLHSRVVVGHLRRASNPLKLSREELLAPENIQPFIHGGWAFAHNGQVNDPLGARKALGGWKGMVRGKNDSEVYFWHFIRALGEARDVGRALQLTESRLVESNTRRGKDAFTCLNVVIAREGEVHGWCRFVRQPKTVPRSLCMKRQGYYTMCFLPGKGRFAVMSEMSRKGDWVQMEDGDLVSARLEGKRVEWRLESLR
jgi:predicted glutamine amidotransferase